MLTLAVDTTADCGSIALADEHAVREEVMIHAPQGFSHVLFGEMDSLLQRQAVKLAEIELFAGASGPGSFTGVRVGLSAIKGLAEVFHRRVVSISNLEALSRFGTSERRAAVIDARRGEVYAALYDPSGNQLIPELVLPLPRFLSLLPPGHIEWIAQDFEPFSPALSGTQAPRALAAAIAQIAIGKAAAGFAMDPAAIEANYVRRSDAELLFKDTTPKPL
jgi:tRNA threonylcarbamoyladenosine biosynthesis protein TsaB